MSTTLLISRTDFDGRVELSSNILDAKINNRILEAQDFDLRSLMGDAFYFDFTTNYISHLDYLELLTGGYYVVPGATDNDNNPITYEFYGIIPVLVYYAAARIVKNIDVNITPFGVTQKNNDFSIPYDPKSLSMLSNNYKNQALSYWNMCTDYLNANYKSFPLWNVGCGATGPQTNSRVAVKVSAIGADNYDGYSDNVQLGFYGNSYGNR